MRTFAASMIQTFWELMTQKFLVSLLIAAHLKEATLPRILSFSSSFICLQKYKVSSNFGFDFWNKDSDFNPVLETYNSSKLMTFAPIYV